MSAMSSGTARSPRTVGPVVTLAARRMWRDRWLVAASFVVVGLASFLAYAGPRIVLGTLDAGAADTFGNDPAAPVIDLVFPVGNTAGNNVDSVRGLGLDGVDLGTQAMIDNVPAATASIVTAHEFWAQLSSFAIVAMGDVDDLATEEGEDAKPAERGPSDVTMTVGFIQGLDAIATEGRLPETTANQLKPGPDMPEAEPLEVALTAPIAARLGIGVGDYVTVSRPRGIPIQLVVVGIWDLGANEDILAGHLPEALAPVTTTGDAGNEVTRVGIIVGPDAAAALTSRTESPLTARLRLVVDPDALTLDLARTIPDQLDNLALETEDLLPGAGITPHLETTVADALRGYPVRAHAALAQMSVLTAGVVAAAAAVIALMARLVVSAREGDIALERARGASVSTTVIALLIEHAVVTAAGVALGYAAARAVAPGADPADPLVGFVAAVSLLAAPMLGGLAARRMWRGRRAPANRTDRKRIQRTAWQRVVTRDVVILAIAVLAVLSLRGRSVLAAPGEGVDLFLSAGPVLVSLAAAVLVLRLYPVPMRLVQIAARRTRRIGGLLSLARAREGAAALPLITLSLSIAVATSGVLLTTTVLAGQETASWQRTGADVRIDAALTAADAASLSDAGLTVSTALHLPVTTITLGSNVKSATLLAVDSRFADAVQAAGLPGADALRSLAARGAAWSPGEPLPAIASQSVSAMDVYGESQIFAGRVYIPITIDGVAGSAADGWSKGAGPYVIVPLEALLRVPTDEAITPNLTFVNGAGADAAVEALGVPREDVTSRHQWLATARDSALIGGVQRVMVLAVSAVAALAAVGLLVSVIDGSRRRSRALALLRTQGVPGRFGWWLAAAELVPLVAGATIAGAAGAALVVWLLAGTLGLDVLTGGLAAPPLAVNSRDLAWGGIGLAVLGFGAILAEVAAQRRSKLSEVLRYGETR